MSEQEILALEAEIEEAAQTMPGALITIDLPVDNIRWLIGCAKRQVKTECAETGFKRGGSLVSLSNVNVL